MTPPPTIPHQTVSGELFRRMSNHVVERGLGRVLAAPSGVRLPTQPVPVQPDIFFVTADREDIIEEKNVEGAPDLVVEILSPGNWTYDRREKYQAYEGAGVPEYWIVDYQSKTVEVFVLKGEVYTLVGKFGSGDTAQSQVMEGFEISIEALFAVLPG